MWWKIWLTGIVGLPWLLGCVPHRSSTPPDTLVVALEASPATLDPRFATDADGMRINSLLFDPLLRLGPDLKMVPVAARHWEYADHVYTFYLRDDLKFHNGRRLEPADVDFTFNWYLSKRCPFAAALDNIIDAHTSKTGDHLIVKVRIKHNSDKFLGRDLPVIKLLPAAELQQDEAAFQQRLIGTGPYRFVQKTENDITLERVAPSPSIRWLDFKTVRDDFTRYQKLLNGEIDIAPMAIAADRVHDFQARNQQFQTSILPSLSMDYLLINHKNPLLARKTVRNALAHSINRAEIVHFKMHDLAEAATSLLPPVSPYFNPHLPAIAFDLQQARAMLAGEDLAAAHLILKTSNTPRAIDHGKILAYQMSQSGLHVSVQSYEWSTFYNDIKQGRFDMAVSRWVGVIDPDLYRMTMLSSEHPPGRNRGSYSNFQVDELLKQADATETRAIRKKLYDQIQELVLEDMAIIPLWYDQQVVISRTSVIGYHPDLAADFQPMLEASKSNE